MPLDLYVLDWNWHIKNAQGAYTFDANLLPFSNETLGWLKHQNLGVALNLQDGFGI